MLSLAATIFVGETLIMLFVEVLQFDSIWYEIVLDAALLSLLTFPCIYFFSFLPLKNQLAIKEAAEKEIQIKNNDLVAANRAIAESQERYVHLFDFSPVGYLVLNHLGVIQEINLTGANLLGIDRKSALERNMDSFLPPDERELWRHHRLQILQNSGKQSFKLVMQRDDETAFYALLDCEREDVLSKTNIRISFTDITEENWAKYQI
jgi:PAS domain S-box-containing protein